MKLAAILFVASLLASQDKAACHSNCFQCVTRCKQDKGDVESCKNTCYQLKAQCCRSCGSGPGPRKTCDCT